MIGLGMSEDEQPINPSVALMIMSSRQ